MARSCAYGALVSVAAMIAASTAVTALELAPSPSLDAPGQDMPADADVEALTGLWSRFESKAEGGPIRFWYFHGNGKGLYRYGKVGLNTTNSFDYAVEDGKLVLDFRKTGQRHVLRFAVETDDEGDQWLAIDGDPKEPGARYKKERGGMGHADLESATSSDGPGGRMWIDWKNYATGGGGFQMYQLNDAAIDGRGIGWYHQGDFDDWSTESLTYRIDGDHLELYFDLREEPAMSHFEIRQDDDGRWLELAEDPRDFWAPHRYRDGGKSFGSAHAWHFVVNSARGKETAAYAH